MNKKKKKKFQHLWILKWKRACDLPLFFLQKKMTGFSNRVNEKGSVEGLSFVSKVCLLCTSPLFTPALSLSGFSNLLLFSYILSTAEEERELYSETWVDRQHECVSWRLFDSRLQRTRTSAKTWEKVPRQHEEPDSCPLQLRVNMLHVISICFALWDHWEWFFPSHTLFFFFWYSRHQDLFKLLLMLHHKAM